jgi:hypothetical protein
MELDLQSLFGLHVQSCTHWLRPRNAPPPVPRILAHIRGRYWSAKIDDISTSRCDPLLFTYSQDPSFSVWLSFKMRRQMKRFYVTCLKLRKKNIVY